jgi:8-oxo-dGTP pyrophosphatase MutT (NUDIX family)
MGIQQPRFDRETRAAIVRNLASFAVEARSAPQLKRAAVCVIVTDDGEGAAAVVVTQRTAHLRTHPGQYALPGGRVDPGESVEDAVRREAREEVGLQLERSDFLGRLDDFPTRSGYLITPLVAWAPAGAALCANPGEVAAIHCVPLMDLSLPGSPQFTTIAESDRPVIRYPILGTLVHAPTAAVLYQFMEVAVHGRATRVAHLEQPTWAWR